MTNSPQDGPCDACKDAGASCKPKKSTSPKRRLRRRPTIAPPLRVTRRTISSATTEDVFKSVPTPQPQQITKCHISIDGGAEYLKASYQLYFPGETGEVAGPLQTVVWFKLESSTPSQIAFDKEGRLIWGIEVRKGLDEGSVDESKVIRRLKPALLDSSKSSMRDVYGNMTHLLSKASRNEVIESLQYYGEDPDVHSLAAVTILSEFYRFAYRSALVFIAGSHGNLGWPIHLDPSDQQTENHPGRSMISVSLPLPVELTPSQTSCVVAAARAAGLPNPYPVDETACALIHHLHLSTGQTIVGKTFLIIDAGAASVDLQVFNVDTVGPLRVQEVALPLDARKTAWCGGSYINDAAVKIAMDLLDIDQFLNDLRLAGSPLTTQQALENAISEDFDQRKRLISGLEPVTLRIHGHKITLSPTDIMNAYAVCLEAMTSMTDKAIESVSGAQARRQNRARHIDEIIVTGGCFRSAYLLDQYRSRYNPSVGHRARHFYPIPVSLPAGAAETSLTVALGGALLGAEKDMIKSRQLRRNFCVARYEQVNPEHYAFHHCEPSGQDGINRLRITRFLIKQGSYPQRFHVPPLEGWRGLLPADMEEDETWIVEEEIWWSDKLSQDGIWIGPNPDPDLDLHPMPKPLTFKLTLKDVQRFPTEKGRRGIRYHYMEYEIGATMDGSMITWTFTYPKSGKWPANGNRYADVESVEASYNTAGVTQMLNAV